jgi:glutamate-1-semialdehyde 2,1-aminomutase
MFGLYFLPQLPTGFADVMKSDGKRFNLFFHEMLNRVVYLAPSLYEAGFVSSAHDDAAIEETIAAAKEAFAVVAKAE